MSTQSITIFAPGLLMADSPLVDDDPCHFIPSASCSIYVFTVGENNVSNINVKFYFANVVDIIIYFDDGSTKRFYQIPCILTTTPEI